ncbi:MAG: DUF3788 domain-containing protein [Firmicutes bacterium]|nr:DUF3788 domain-containing protein [Bacillota bacterium]
MKYENLRLRDQHIHPTSDVLENALGESHQTYETFVGGLGDLNIENVWQFYPCFATKAWMGRGEYKWTTPRGANKTKNIYWLSVWEELFKVTLWFKEDNRAEILKTNITESTKQLIKNSKMFGPKMRTFPVEFEIIDANSLTDVYTLLKHKIQLEAR